MRHITFILFLILFKNVSAQYVLTIYDYKHNKTISIYAGEPIEIKEIGTEQFSRHHIDSIAANGLWLKNHTYLPLDSIAAIVKPTWFNMQKYLVFYMTDIVLTAALSFSDEGILVPLAFVPVTTWLMFRNVISAKHRTYVSGKLTEIKIVQAVNY